MKRMISRIACIILLVAVFAVSVYAYDTYDVVISIDSDFTKSFDGNPVIVTEDDFSITETDFSQLIDDGNIRFVWYSEDGEMAFGTEGPSETGWYRFAVELNIWDEWQEMAYEYFEIKDGDTHVHHYVFECDDDWSTHTEFCPGCGDIAAESVDHRYAASVNSEGGFSVTYDYVCLDCGYVYMTTGQKLKPYTIKAYDCPLTSLSYKISDFPDVEDGQLNIDVRMIPYIYANASETYIEEVLDAINKSGISSTEIAYKDIPVIADITLNKGIETYDLSEGQSVEVCICLGKDNYELLKSGKASLVHIKGDSAEIVSIDGFIEETYSVRFSVSSFSPFALVELDAAEGYYGRYYLSQQPNGEGLVQMYDAISRQVARYVDVVDIGIPAGCTIEDIDVVIDAYTGDYGKHFWFGGFEQIGYTSTYIKLYPVYFNGLANDTSKNTFESAAYSFLEEAGIDLGRLSSYSQNELALMIHDALVNNVEYNLNQDDPDAYNFSAYGALIDGLTCCEGYSEAYQYLLELVGIRSHLVRGYANESHQWNIVEIDGNWYMTDVTWDDPSGGAQSVYHAYYNLTDDEMEEDHTVMMSYTLPECNSSLRYTDIPENGHYLVDSASMYDEVIDQLSNGADYATVFVSDDTDVVTWINSNVMDIITDLDIYGDISVGLESARDEYHIYVYTTIAVSCDIDDPAFVIKDSNGNPADDSGEFHLRSGQSFRFAVHINEGYYEGEDFAVKADGVELEKDPSGHYETDNLFADAVITVSGIEKLKDLSEIGSIVINNNQPAHPGDVIERTSFTGFDDGSDIEWQWFIDNEAQGEAGPYETFTVGNAAVGHDIKLRATGCGAEYTGFTDSNWVGVISLIEPELSINVKENITYDLSAVSCGTGTGNDITYTTNSTGIVTVAWYSFGDGSVDEANRLGGAPKDAGKYFVAVTVGSDGTYREKTAEAQFEIKPLSGGAAVKPSLNSKGARSLTVNTTITRGVRQRYLIRPVSDPAYSMYDDNEWGWVDPESSTFTFDVDLKPYTTYRIYTYWPGNGNFGQTDVVYTDFTTLKAKIDFPAEDTTVFNYDGEEKTYQISEDEGYTVSGITTKSNAGTTNIILSLTDKEHTTWSDDTTEDKIYEFTINAKPLTMDMITVQKSADENSEFTATGEPVKPVITVKDGDLLLVEDVDYTLNYHINGNESCFGDPLLIGVGYYSIDVTAVENGNYSGSFLGDEIPELQYTVDKAEYSGEDISGRIVIKTDTAVGTKISLTDRANWTNLPLNFVITNCIFEGSSFPSQWGFEVNDIVIKEDLTSLADTYSEIKVSLECSIYDTVENVTLRIEFEEPAPAPVLEEIELVEDSGMNIQTVDGLGKLLEGLAPKNSVTELKTKLENPENIKIFKNDGTTEITEDAYVGTGCYIRLYDGDTLVDEIRVVVMGDLNGDGEVKSNDALKALKAGVGTEIVDEIFYYAGNLNHDEKITSAEALRILKYSVGTITTLD